MIRLGLLLTLVLNVFGHGVQHHILQGGVGVEVHHEVLLVGDVEVPLANAQVQVYRPDVPLEPFQLGQTDPHGIFMFNPDTIGVWTVKFLDEQGHGKQVHVQVNQLGVIELEPQFEQHTFRDAFAGVGYILFAVALWMMVKKKQD